MNIHRTHGHRPWIPLTLALLITVFGTLGLSLGTTRAEAASITRVKPTMKILGDGPYMPGGKITYEITQSLEQIANKAVTSFEFEDDLPEGIVNVNVKLLIDGQDPHGAEEAHYFINGRHVTCSIYQQAFDKYFKYGDSPTKVVFTLICDIGSKVDEGTLLTNVAYCTINDSRESTEPITANVGHEPEYTLSKTATQQSAKKGETVNYQVKVGNTGEGSGPQVQVTDTPAEGISINAQSVTVTGLEDGQYTVDRDSLSQEPAALKVSFPKLPASADVTIAYNATVTSDGEENERLVNNVKLQDASMRQKTANATVTLAKPALTLTKTAGATSVDVGDQVTYTLKVKNTSTLASISNVQVSDAPPAGLKIDSNTVEVTGGSGSPQKTVTEDSLQVNVGTLAPQGEATITYKATAQPDATFDQSLSSQASAQADGIDQVQSSGDTGNVTVNYNPSLSFTMTGQTPVEGSVDVGKSVNFTVTITNDSPVTVRHIQFENPVPQGLVVTKAPQLVQTERGNSINEGEVHAEEGKVTAEIPELPSEASLQLAYSAFVTSDAPNQVTNTSTVQADKVASQSQSYSFNVNKAAASGSLPQTGVPSALGLLVGGGITSSCALAATSWSRKRNGKR